MDSRKISVVIPCWNAAKYIAELLDCLIRQTYLEWSAYVVDDGSTDDSISIVQQYQSFDPRIHQISRGRSPKGGQTCRNIGLECSAGSEYVIFFDADDLISTNCLEQRVQYMDSHPELDFAVFPARTFVSTPDEEEINDIWGYDIFKDNLGAMINRTLPMVGWTNIYRMSSVQSNNLEWDEKIMSLQDSDWNIQAIVKGLKYCYAEREGATFDYFYRISISGSVSKRITSLPHLESHIYFLNKVYSCLTEIQKERYDIDYRSNLFSFFEYYELNTKAVFKLLSTDYCRTHLLFSMRIILWKAMRRRAKSIVFHKEVLHRKNAFDNWALLKQKIIGSCYVRKYS